MKSKQIVHYLNTIGLVGKLLLGDKEIISRINDLDFIKDEYKLKKKTNRTAKEEQELINFKK